MSAGGKRVGSFRFVALNATHGRSHNDVLGRERPAEETRLVDCAILRKLFVRQHAVVDAHGLDRSDEPALLTQVQRAARASDAKRVRTDVTFVCAGLHGIGDRRRLENVVLCSVADGRHVAAFPGVLVRTIGQGCVSAICVLEGETATCSGVHVVVEIQLVVVARADEVWPKHVRICGRLQRLERIRGRVANDLDSHGVGEAGERVDELREGLAAEIVAVIPPYAGVVLIVLDACDVAVHEVDPLRRGPVVRLVRADVADAVEVQDKSLGDVIVEERVEGDGHVGVRTLPLPREADLGGGVGGGVGAGSVGDRRTPSGAVPGFKRVAGTAVDRAVEACLLRRGEGVAVLVVGVYAGAFVALQAGDGGRHDDIRHGDAGEEARFVNGAVRGEFRIRQHFVVHANRLDRADEIAVVEIILGRAATAEEPVQATGSRLGSAAASPPVRRWEGIGSRDDLLVVGGFQRGVEIFDIGAARHVGTGTV